MKIPDPFQHKLQLGQLIGFKEQNFHKHFNKCLLIISSDKRILLCHIQTVSYNIILPNGAVVQHSKAIAQNIILPGIP